MMVRSRMIGYSQTAPCSMCQDYALIHSPCHGGVYWLVRLCDVTILELLIGQIMCDVTIFKLQNNLFLFYLAPFLYMAFLCWVWKVHLLDCFVEWWPMRACYLDHVTKQLSLTQISVTVLWEGLRLVPRHPPTSCVPSTSNNKEVSVYRGIWKKITSFRICYKICISYTCINAVWHCF